MSKDVACVKPGCGAQVPVGASYCGECGTRRSEPKPESPEALALYTEAFRRFVSDGVLEAWEQEELTHLRDGLGVSEATHQRLMASIGGTKGPMAAVRLEIDSAAMSDYAAGTPGIFRWRLTNDGKRAIAAAQLFAAIEGQREVIQKSTESIRPGGDAPLLMSMVLHLPGQHVLGAFLVTELHDGSRQVWRADVVPFQVVPERSPANTTSVLNIDASAMRVGDLSNIRMGDTQERSRSGLLSNTGWVSVRLSPSTDDVLKHWQEQHAPAAQREALSSINTTPLKAKNRPREIVVDASGGADVRSIGAAISAVDERGVVHVRTGRYHESIVVDRNIVVKADAPGVVVESDGAPALTVTGGAAKFLGIAFVNTTAEPADDEEQSDDERDRRREQRCAVAVGGGTVRFEDCSFESNAGTAFRVSGSNSRPVIRGCDVSGSALSGFLFEDEAMGVLEKCKTRGTRGPGLDIRSSASPSVNTCEFSGSSDAGICITGGSSSRLIECLSVGNKDGANIKKSSPVFDGCVFEKNSGRGVYAFKSSPTFNACDFRLNGSDGVRLKSSTGQFSKSVFNENGRIGIFVCGEGSGPTFDACKSHANKGSGAVVSDAAKSSFKDCQFYGAKEGSGIVIDDNGAGTFEACDSYANKFTGATVRRANPTFRNCRFYDSKESAGIHVYDNGAGTFESCDSYANKLDGTGVEGGANPTFRACRFFDSRDGGGILVYKNGAGIFEACESYANKLPGAQVSRGANPSFRDCRFYDSKEHSGILVDTDGSGTFEACESFANKMAGAEVKKAAKPYFKDCRFYDSKERSGILVHDNGAGTFETCESYANKRSGAEVKGGANPTFRGCRFYESKEGNGIFVYKNGEGTFEGCESYANELSGAEVSDGSNPSFNDCRFYESRGGGGIFVHNGGAGNFEACESYANKLAGAEITDRANPSFKDCRFYESREGNGIHVFDNGAGRFESCESYANKGMGVKVLGGATPTFKRCRFHDAQTGVDVTFGPDSKPILDACMVAKVQVLNNFKSEEPEEEEFETFADIDLAEVGLDADPLTVVASVTQVPHQEKADLPPSPAAVIVPKCPRCAPERRPGEEIAVFLKRIAKQHGLLLDDANFAKRYGGQCSDGLISLYLGVFDAYWLCVDGCPGGVSWLKKVHLSALTASISADFVKVLQSIVEFKTRDASGGAVTLGLVASIRDTMNMVVVGKQSSLPEKQTSKVKKLIGGDVLSFCRVLRAGISSETVAQFFAVSGLLGLSVDMDVIGQGVHYRRS